MLQDEKGLLLHKKRGRHHFITLIWTRGGCHQNKQAQKPETIDRNLRQEVQFLEITSPHRDVTFSCLSQQN